MTGLRLNIAFDWMHLTKAKTQIAILNTDLRIYTPLYRKIIWANKFSAAYSLGSGKVSYYLGAVENWTSRNQFSGQTPYLTGSDIYFQYWVSNLRGFSRGVRVGNSFMLVNSEIRVPLFQTLYPKPIESEFIRNFTITGFTDIGTAFIGKSTSDPNNPFNTVQYSTPNYDITVTSRRNPFVIGVGYGIRTRFLGYFVKFDRGRGYLEHTWQKPMNYFSLGFDF
jgi:hypothetical protein